MGNDKETADKGMKVVLEWLKNAASAAREVFFKQLPNEEQRQFWEKKLKEGV